ncbi:uncharacterized protein LOC26527016 [Drosophila erecta]|uniref:MD-2-related lipid-recognition domain-containing protein n=1 Tax=Drosophila erecta TaxID=7220 RepID=A0A0Q5VN28_DROER|nr:uncharacterized protein LOC26527016 [Drosophila erecta]KQS62775.1 uncharacterized protein Dere_GG27192 [Drosophila erecta]
MHFSVGFLVIMYLIEGVHSLVEFTNFECELLDRSFCGVEYCRIKSMNRTYKYLSLKVNLFKTPVTDVKVCCEYGLYQRLNGYKPFLYNVTVDACKFLTNQNSHPIFKFIYVFFKHVFNMNHSCPYDHDIIMEKVTAENINHHMTKILPFPKGKYMFKMHWIAYNINRAIIRVYITLT